MILEVEINQAKRTGKQKRSAFEKNEMMQRTQEYFSYLFQVKKDDNKKMGFSLNITSCLHSL